MTMPVTDKIQLSAIRPCSFCVLCGGRFGLTDYGIENCLRMHQC